MSKFDDAFDQARASCTLEDALTGKSKALKEAVLVSVDDNCSFYNPKDPNYPREELENVLGGPIQALKLRELPILVFILDSRTAQYNRMATYLLNQSIGMDPDNRVEIGGPVLFVPEPRNEDKQNY